MGYSEKLFPRDWEFITREQRGWDNRKRNLGTSFQKILGSQQSLPAEALKHCLYQDPSSPVCVCVCLCDLATC